MEFEELKRVQSLFLYQYYTMNFCLFSSSFSFLWGPVNHAKHLCSFGRLPFTAAYFGSMFATLYMAMIVSVLIFPRILLLAAY